MQMQNKSIGIIEDQIMQMQNKSGILEDQVMQMQNNSIGIIEGQLMQMQNNSIGIIEGQLMQMQNNSTGILEDQIMQMQNKTPGILEWIGFKWTRFASRRSGSNGVSLSPFLSCINGHVSMLICPTKMDSDDRGLHSTVVVTFRFQNAETIDYMSSLTTACFRFVDVN